MAYDPHYNPNQPRVPKGQPHGGEWTRVASASGAGLLLRELVAAAARAQAQRAAAALALRQALLNGRLEEARGVAAEQAVLERFALFDALSERNNARQQAVIEFRAGDYRRLGDLAVTRVAVLSRAEAQAVCRRLPAVQKALDDAVEHVETHSTVRRASNPALYGTKVHLEAARIINAMGEKNFRAEVYWLAGDIGKGGLGSVKMDAQEEPADKTTLCIYDGKTGKEGLSPKRMLDLARGGWAKGRTRIVVMEVRPTKGF